MAFTHLLHLPSNILASRGRYTPLGHDSASSVDLVKGKITGSILRGAIAGICGVAFLVRKNICYGNMAGQVN